MNVKGSEPKVVYPDTDPGIFQGGWLSRRLGTNAQNSLLSVITVSTSHRVFIVDPGLIVCSG